MKLFVSLLCVSIVLCAPSNLEEVPQGNPTGFSHQSFHPDTIQSQASVLSDNEPDQNPNISYDVEEESFIGPSSSALEEQPHIFPQPHITSPLQGQYTDDGEADDGDAFPEEGYEQDFSHLSSSVSEVQPGIPAQPIIPPLQKQFFDDGNVDGEDTLYKETEDVVSPSENISPNGPIFNENQRSDDADEPTDTVLIEDDDHWNPGF